jgi:hypothetical protein
MSGQFTGAWYRQEAARVRRDGEAMRSDYLRRQMLAVAEQYDWLATLVGKMRHDHAAAVIRLLHPN